MSQSSPVRIVSLSSSAHKFGAIDGNDLHFKKGRAYSAWPAYGQSKLANLLFAKSLSDRYKELGKDISAVAVHPGVINTNLTRHTGPVGTFFFNTFFVDKNIPQGASSSVYALLNPDFSNYEKYGGVYITDCAVTAESSLGKDESGSVRKELWEASKRSLEQALAGKTVE